MYQVNFDRLRAGGSAVYPISGLSAGAMEPLPTQPLAAIIHAHVKQYK